MSKEAISADPMVSDQEWIDSALSRSAQLVGEKNAEIILLKAEVERLRRQDEVHWRTRRSLLSELERAAEDRATGADAQENARLRSALEKCKHATYGEISNIVDEALNGA